MPLNALSKYIGKYINKCICIQIDVYEKRHFINAIYFDNDKNENIYEYL